MSPRVNFNEGQEVTYQDLNKVAQAIEKEVLDRVLYEMSNRQTDFFFGDGFKPTYVNATTVQVALGSGVQTDGTQTDPEPTKRLMHNAANTNVTLAAADPTNPRYDIISVKAARDTTLSENRNFKDASTLVVSSVSMAVKTDWEADIVVTQGTPAGSPSVPSTPAGYIKIAECLVTAATGLAGASAVVDKRTRYKKPSSWKAQTATKSANYTADMDDEVIPCDTSGGAFTVTLPDPTLCQGKEFELVQVGVTSANEATVSPNVNGASQGLSGEQYSTFKVRSNGTIYTHVG